MIVDAARARRAYEAYWRFAAVMNWVLFFGTVAWAAWPGHRDWLSLASVPVGLALNLVPMRRFVEWAALTTATWVLVSR